MTIQSIATRLTQRYGWKGAWERAAYRRAKWGVTLNYAPVGSPAFFRAATLNTFWAGVSASILRGVE